MKFISYTASGRCICLFRMLWVGFFLVCAGCDAPEQGESKYVLQQRKGIPGVPQHSEQAQEEPEAVLEMLKESEIENDSELVSIEQWVEQKLIEDGGQIMFPEWEVKRRGMRKYVVDFTYTVLKENHAIEKKGFRWNVDYVLQLISAPSYISEEELNKESGHKSIMNYGPSQSERVINLE